VVHLPTAPRETGQWMTAVNDIISLFHIACHVRDFEALLVTSLLAQADLYTVCF